MQVGERIGWAPIGPFGETLQQLREHSGLSQLALAKRCGVSHTTISRLENGSRMPSRLLVLRLGRALGLDTFGLAKLFVSAGYWPTLRLGAGQAEVAELALLIADQKLDDEARADLAARLRELAEWTRGIIERNGGKR